MFDLKMHLFCDFRYCRCETGHPFETNDHMISKHYSEIHFKINKLRGKIYVVHISLFVANIPEGVAPLYR